MTSTTMTTTAKRIHRVGKDTSEQEGGADEPSQDVPGHRQVRVLAKLYLTAWGVFGR